MTRGDRDKLLAVMRQELYAVQASASALGRPQAALVGVVVSDEFEVFFDTLASSRKTINLRQNAAAALVLGPAASAAERTVQVEGTADEPTGAELERLLELYFARFPDGRRRQEWPGITYWRIRPTWLRYGDYSVDPPEIREFTSSELAQLLENAAGTSNPPVFFRKPLGDFEDRFRSDWRTGTPQIEALNEARDCAGVHLETVAGAEIGQDLRLGAGNTTEINEFVEEPPETRWGDMPPDVLKAVRDWPEPPP